jgi:hypothetical protein
MNSNQSKTGRRIQIYLSADLIEKWDKLPRYERSAEVAAALRKHWSGTPDLIIRLQSIRERFTSEDTGQGFGRPEIAWAMADDLRILIEELEKNKTI